MRLPRFIRAAVRAALWRWGARLGMSGTARHKLIPQSAVIPYRRRDGRLEVLLITSRRSGDWIVPKGLIEPDMTDYDSAAKEAREEAGVLGRVGTRAVGAFEYEKWGGVCHVSVFDMEVESELRSWPEKGSRDRRWVPVTEAAELVKRDELAALIRGLPKRVAGR